FPKPEYAAQIPHSITRYDEGITGQQVRWWNGTTIGGAPKAHAYDPGQLRDTNATRPTGVNADGAFARYSGDITYPQAGDYTMQICVGLQDAAWLYVDGRLVTQAWGINGTDCGTANQPAAVVRALGPNETHRVQVDYV